MNPGTSSDIYMLGRYYHGSTWEISMRFYTSMRSKDTSQSRWLWCSLSKKLYFTVA